MSQLNASSFIEVNGWKVWFEKIGSGPEPVLLIPGAVGTARTDFDEFLDREDEFDFEKFTIIAVEAPGWGRSRPPIRKYGVNVYGIDCECFHTVMKDLGYDKYSIIGFSDGARVALLMATKYPDCVRSIVLCGLSTHYTLKGIKAMLSENTVDKWKKDKLEAHLKIYGSKDELIKLWNRYLKFVEFFNQYFPEDMFKNKYQLVKCPVLITHGKQDPFIEVEQPLIVSKRLMNAKLHQFPDGGHESHQRHCTKFSELVQDHILNLPDYNISVKERVNERLTGMGWE